MTTLVATTTFRVAGEPGKRGPFIRAGQLVDSTDPVVEGREHLFTDVDERASKPSQPITSKRPAKKAAKKSAS